MRPKAAKTCAARRLKARFFFAAQVERLAYKKSLLAARAPEKVVATVSRREGVYNRAGEPSVPFWDRGAAALLVVAVAFTRLHDYDACCDAVGQGERLEYKSSRPKGLPDAIPYYSFDFPQFSVEKSSFYASDMFYIRRWIVPKK